MDLKDVIVTLLISAGAGSLLGIALGTLILFLTHLVNINFSKYRKL